MEYLKLSGTRRQRTMPTMRPSAFTGKQSECWMPNRRAWRIKRKIEGTPHDDNAVDIFELSGGSLENPSKRERLAHELGDEESF